MLPPHKIRRSRGILGFMETITDKPYSTLLIVWMLMLFSFALGYFILTALAPRHGLQQLASMGIAARLFNSIYFSIITSTTVGYGDITPLGFSKVLASLEGIAAFFVFAVFVTKLVSYHQEIALHQIHKLTFEDVFYNTREGLFIIRKDFDALIAEAEETGHLSPHAWENLTIAYREGQSLLEQIPDFYDNDHHLYTIDAKREQLLQEAVHRTLHRINQMLDVFSRARITWASHEGSAAALHELIRIVLHVTPLWREKSSSLIPEPFEEILIVSDSIRTRFAHALPLDGQ